MASELEDAMAVVTEAEKKAKEIFNYETADHDTMMRSVETLVECAKTRILLYRARRGLP